MLIQVRDLEFSYNINEIFKDVNFVINEGDKIGMVGDNGSGKSTLAKCLAGILEAKGKIFYKPEMKISYLKQQISVNEKRTVMELALEKYQDVLDLEKSMRAMEGQMADLAEDPDALERLMEDYQAARDAYDNLNGYAYMSEIKGYLAMVGMGGVFFDRSVHSLSGGEKARLELALIFMEKPDLLILDEPTNHMDVEMIAYLERVLTDFKGAVLFISHDRLLLQNVAQRIFDVNNGSVEVYDMGYDKYREVKRARIEEQQRHYESFKEEEKRQLEIIRRYRSYARDRFYRQAKSREKMLARMKAEEPPKVDQAIRFRFKEPQRTGNDVLTAVGLSKSFPDKNLFKDINFEVKAQDRLAILGPNGSGKTTLFNILNDKATYDGEFLWGTGVKLGYFNQELKVLDEENTIVDEISDEYPRMNIYEIRTLLGSFLFTGDDVFKEMKDLSGGERARVSLLKLILSGANVLMLDEPTNHLDLTSKEVLEEALLAFKGTLIFISHDRYFVKKLATKVLDMTPDEQQIYMGDFDYYMSRKYKKDQDEYEEVNKTQIQKDRKREREEIRKSQAIRRKIAEVEADIEKIENEIDQIDQELSRPEIYEDHEKVLDLDMRRKDLADKLEKKMDEWTELSE